MLYLVELTLDRLAQFNLIDVAENEGGLDDLAKGFQRPIQRVLLRIGVESPENFRGGGFFEHDRRDQAQNVVPILFEKKGDKEVYRDRETGTKWVVEVHQKGD